MIGLIRKLSVEADPKVYLDLQINVSQFINQKAYNNLLYDKIMKKLIIFSDNDRHHLQYLNLEKTLKILK